MGNISQTNELTSLILSKLVQIPVVRGVNSEE